MRNAEVFYNKKLAGFLIEESRSKYTFRYEDTYFSNHALPAISLTLPKTQQEYKSEVMFPFFSNMIAEGTNLAIQSRYLKIDENDVMSLLTATANVDSIGAVTVKLKKAL